MNTRIYHVTGDLTRSMPEFGLSAGFARVEFYIAPADLQDDPSEAEVAAWASGLVNNAFSGVGVEGDDIRVSVESGHIDVPIPDGISVTIPDSMPPS
ncbi:hypothetical protein K8O93_01020 [Gordonia bronchialis]|uniref:hypothetical protein n=1 Tax=Gordonia bronchialis TaxID=2054 RepID=UPI001CBE55C3|nr:hypothetical protein [Gordonia bronchialis]UAK38415.1 hypothetical protein K8O93_01020 [Gordonia bronchialis]